MSVLNTIKLNSTEYNISDSGARTSIGDLSNLETTAKNNLVAAINEAMQTGGVEIDPTLTEEGDAADAKATGDAVSDLQRQLISICDSLTPMASEHYRLNGDGTCTSDQTANLKKYSVTSGTLLYIKASKDFNGVFQWQSESGVPFGGQNPKLVGSPVNEAFDGFIAVPSGAFFLYVSSSVNNTTNVVAYTKKISEQIDELSGMETHLYEYSAKDRTNDTTANGVYIAYQSSEWKARFEEGTISYYFDLGSKNANYVITPSGNNRFRIARTSMTKQEFDSMVENQTVTTLGTGVSLDNDLDTPYVINGDGTYTAIIVYIGQSGTATIEPVGMAECADNIENVAEANTISKIRSNFVVGSPQLYTGSVLENNNLSSLTVTDIYSIYDTLVSEHPEIITRETDIGNGSDGSAIRHYIVRMQDPVLNPSRGTASLDDNIWTSSYDYRSIVINAGTHGDEKSSVYGVAMFIKELVESSADWAGFIKGNFILHIIPVLNIYGFNNGQRANSKSKDINRSFLDVSTEEATVLTTFIQNDPKIEIVIDSHNDTCPVGYLGAYLQNEWAIPLIQMSAKIAGATKPFLTTLYNDSSKSPYMLAMIEGHTYVQTLDGWAGKNGYIPCLIEAPRALEGGVTNYGKGGNITKLLLGNVIQSLGCMQ